MQKNTRIKPIKFGAVTWNTNRFSIKLKHDGKVLNFGEEDTIGLLKVTPNKVQNMHKEHHNYIRIAIHLATQAKEKGNHPFGAVLVNASGELLLESENTVVSENDITGHAELNLVKKAAQLYDKSFLATCTLYSSTEPCPMCAGSIFWSNIRKVVYGLSERSFYKLFDKNKGDILYLQCKDVLNKGNKKIQVIGPVLEEEALESHIGFWEF